MYVCGCLDRMGSNPVVKPFHGQIAADILFHTDKSEKLWEEGWWTTDNISGNVPHQKPWMYAALLCDMCVRKSPEACSGTRGGNSKAVAPGFIFGGTPLVRS